MTPSQPAMALPSLPSAPTPPPVFASGPLGQKPGTKSTTPTVLGAGFLPTQGNSGAGKTLLGQ